MGLIVVLALPGLYKSSPAGRRQGYIIAFNPFPENLIENVVWNPIFAGEIKPG